MRKEFRTKLKGDDSRADASAYFTLPFDTRDVWGRVKMCTYKCIDTRQRRSYPVLVATSLCGLNGMNRKTDKTFASTMFALKRLCSFSMIPTLLRNATRSEEHTSELQSRL